MYPVAPDDVRRVSTPRDTWWEQGTVPRFERTSPSSWFGVSFTYVFLCFLLYITYEIVRGHSVCILPKKKGHSCAPGSYLSASEVRLDSTVARLSKESGCAIAREAWEGMEHLIHRRRRGAAQGFSSLALTCDPSPERTFARIEVPFEMVQRRHRRRCTNPGAQARRGRTAS